ncbi:MAG: hypothetical protein EBU01_10550, partial [Crocinitomicaceae bacterium]|nr:hypothetical protein [Crocinitomicaceae bacterium]
MQSCGTAEKASVYKPGRVWEFDVTVQDSSGIIVDSFQLNMKTRNSNVAEKAIRQITVEYEYLKNGKTFDTETTGIEDNTQRVHIHPPRDSYFDVSEVVHFPFITKPIGLGFKSSTEIVIQKASYTNRKTNEKIDLAGKRIKQEIALIDSTAISFKKKELKCFVVQGKNLNYLKELGQFTGKFYFNEKYGFVKFIYTTPWKSTIVANLK